VIKTTVSFRKGGYKMSQDTLKATLFLKSGEQQNTHLPIEFINELLVNVQQKGVESVHLANGKSLDVIAVMVGSQQFYKEERVILMGAKEEINE
jgi:hypothetical protein